MTSSCEKEMKLHRLRPVDMIILSLHWRNLEMPRHHGPLTIVRTYVPTFSCRICFRKHKTIFAFFYHFSRLI